MHLFYTPDLVGDDYCLNEEESKHCIRVLRLTQGDRLFLVDGIGQFCEALIENPHPRGCQLKVIGRQVEYGLRNYELSIAVAPTKNIDRFEWFLEKATEIGIDHVVPLVCRYSERKEIKVDRLEKVMVSAMKQSLKAYLPELANLQKFSEFIKKPFEGNRFIAHCYEEEKILFRDAIKKGENVLILIGPEGDFSHEEIRQAINEGFIPVSLGDSRLRTETAALVACHTVNLINQ